MAAKPSSTAVALANIPRKLQTPKQSAIEEILCYPILLSEQIAVAVNDSHSFKLECSKVGKQVNRLCQMLHSAARLASSSTPAAPFYDRPLRRIAAEVSRNLEKSLTLAKQCSLRSFLRRFISNISTEDFVKLLSLLDSSVEDMKWVLSIYDASNGGIVLIHPPIASNDPILSRVWFFIASLHMGQLQDKIKAAGELLSLAKENDRNKQIIVDEGGVLPLLKLLKDNSSPDGQFAASSTLSHISNSEERVQAIIDDLGIPIIVQTLKKSSKKVQIGVCNLIAKMAEHCPLAKECFVNVIRTLVTFLSLGLFMDDLNLFMDDLGLFEKHSRIHFIAEINKEIRKPKMKISCAEALWMLAKGSVQNSRRITEGRGLLFLAKLVEIESGELQRNCLMTIVEITAAAESDADLRRETFKSNSPASKAVFNQLLRVIKDLDDVRMQIAAIRAIGCVAQAFPARETRVIEPLIQLLDHRDQEVGAEAAGVLGKFACSDSCLCVDHSKTIIESGGVDPLVRLLRGSEKAMLNGLVLMCYLAINVGKSYELELAAVLNVFEEAGPGFVDQHPELKELITQANHHLFGFHQSHTGLLAQRPFRSDALFV
ncbi:hypothetical protein CASFOL_021339 [Castilleja foliolosa]|uniref:DUF7792 domain-containing protein n=1 Tax=Castilleja foliolosa TaxID=1961234 RepID=A0ABD3D019_9LAMI